MNIENATAQDLIDELSCRVGEGFDQYNLYPEDSVEQKQVMAAQRLPLRMLNLLMDTEEDPAFFPLKERVLIYVKNTLLAEQNKRLEELELSQRFLNGGMECTIQA